MTKRNGALPSNLEAERFVLGTMLLSESDYALIAMVLEANDFAIESHRRIFLRMGELYARGDKIDRITVTDELRKHNQLESVGGITYLVTLTDDWSIGPADSHLRIVKEKSILRQAIYAAQGLIDRCMLQQDDSSDVLRSAEILLRELGTKSNTRDSQTYEGILDDLGGINAFAQEQHPGIQTPFSVLNREIVGFMPGDLAVLGARPSSGKSAFAQQVGDYVAERYGTVASFQLEQKERRVLMRGIARVSSEQDGEPLSVNEIRSGMLNHAQRQSLRDACLKLVTLPAEINTSARTSIAIHAGLRRLMARTPVKLVVIDHLHEMRGVGRAEKRIDEVRRLTSDIKVMAADLDVPVLLLAQLNRGPENESRKPTMRDLRECGDIEQIADIILFLHSEEKMSTSQQKQPFTEVSLLVAKQRDGARFIEIPMYFHGRHFKFVQAERET